MNIKLDIPEKFFEGEERCGYYVSPENEKSLGGSARSSCGVFEGM